MEGKWTVVRRFGYFVLASAVLVAYQNCSMQSAHDNGDDLASLAKTCENALAVTYRQTYYKSFRQNCTSCHDTGGESGRPFASKNFNEAWLSFSSVGRAKIEYNATNAGHKAPKTGPQHQALIDGAKAAWAAAEAMVEQCNAAQEITTTKKTLPANVYTTNPGNNAAWPQLAFDLNSDLTNPDLVGKLRIQFSVEVRRQPPPAGTTTNLAYEFKNPRVTVTGAAPLPSYRIRGFKIMRNGSTVQDLTFFENIDAVVNAGTPTLIQSGGNWAALWTTTEPLANTDEFQIKFLRIEDGSGLPITGGGGGTGGGSGLPTRVSYNELAGGNVNLNVFTRRCFSCHGVGGAGGLNLTQYANAQASAALIQQRMNNAANPMPPQGLLSADERQLVDIWISSGAPQN